MSEFEAKFQRNWKFAENNGLLKWVDDDAVFSPLIRIFFGKRNSRHYLPGKLREIHRKNKGVVYFKKGNEWYVPDASVVSEKLSGKSRIEPQEFISLVTAFQSESLLAECAEFCSVLSSRSDTQSLEEWSLLCVVEGARAAADSLAKDAADVSRDLLKVAPIAFDTESIKKKAEEAARRTVKGIINREWTQHARKSLPGSRRFILGSSKRLEEQLKNEDRTDGVHWFIIEGLDGRRLFARGLTGLHTMASCVAKWENHQLVPIASAVLNDATGDLVCGVRGRLLLLNDIHHTYQQIHARDDESGDPIANAFVVSHLSTSRRDRAVWFEDGILKDLSRRVEQRILILPSGQLTAAWVACQKLDALIVPSVRFTSYFPGVCLLTLLWSSQKSGKRSSKGSLPVTDFKNKPFGPDSTDLLAARSPELHDAFYDLIRFR